MRNEGRRAGRFPSAGFPATGGIVEAVTGFCRFARAQGHRIGVEETLDSLTVASLGLLRDERSFRLALRALLCAGKDQRDAFNALFDAYWHGSSAGARRAASERSPERVWREPAGSPLLAAAANREAKTESEGKSTGGASPEERLRRTDFARVPRDQQEPLEELARRLWRRMSLRLSRRLKAASRRDEVNLRRTIRRNTACGGDPIELLFKGKKPRKPRLVLLLDVSGSMDRYSFFLLRFIYALQKHCRRVDSFAFSTRLLCITELLQDRSMEEVLAEVSKTAETWSSGTRMGECLARFNQVHGARTLSRRALVIILSDGLDTGDPDSLAWELAKIKRRTKKLIWLNPLLGSRNYEPLARGIRAALPMIDVFQSAHNLESLLGLESHLTDV